MLWSFDYYHMLVKLNYRLYLENEKCFRWTKLPVRIVSKEPRKKSSIQQTKHKLRAVYENSSNRYSLCPYSSSDWFDWSSFATWYVAARSKASRWHGVTWLSNGFGNRRHANLSSSSEIAWARRGSCAGHERVVGCELVRSSRTFDELWAS